MENKIWVKNLGYFTQFQIIAKVSFLLLKRILERCTANENPPCREREREEKPMKYVGSLVTTCYCFIFCFAFCCSALKITPSEKTLAQNEGRGGWVDLQIKPAWGSHLPPHCLLMHSPFPSFLLSLYLSSSFPQIQSIVVFL